jgi:hypothetical protein
MAKKRDDATELAEKLVAVLDRQRSLDGEAYPLAIQRLVELTDPRAPWALVERAITRRAFTDRACLAQKKNPTSPVALCEDLDRLAAASQVLELALEATCTPARPAQPLNRVVAKVDARLREPFEQVVTRQIREGTLPSAVGCQLVRNKPQLFLQRMPLPRDPVLVLAEKLVRTLEGQRELGGEAYPPSLRKLVELTDPAAVPVLLKKALGKEPFKSRAMLALKTHPETPVSLAEDSDRLAASPQLVAVLLEVLRKETDHAFLIAKLKTKLPPVLRAAFVEAVNQQAEAGRLARGVGWLWTGKKRQLFLLQDIQGGQTPAPLPDFATLFERAFDRLDRAGGSHNFVSLVPLRHAVGLPRPAFDQGLQQLRRAGRYTLSAAEGRHGLTAEEQEAGVNEDGMLLLYVSRRST